MENIFIVIVCLLIAIASSDKRLLILISVSSIIQFAIYELDFDIALYYSLSSSRAIIIAYYAKTNINKVPANCYAVLMLIQCVLCLLLVPCYSFTINAILQYVLNTYNDMLYLIIICIGIAGSGNIFASLYSSNYYSDH